MQEYLSKSSGIFGVRTCWEPNTYDALDEESTGSPGTDANGRFVPYV